MKPASICIVGVFPPPLHGMSMITEHVKNRLTAFSPPHIIDFSPRTHNRSFNVRFRKLFRVIECLVKFTLLMISGRVRCVYFGLSGGYGQIYDLVFVGISRLFCTKRYLHHHGYQYLIHKRWTTNLLSMMAGKNAVHIVACEKMASDLKRLYPTVTETRVISGIVAIDSYNDEINYRRGIRTVGFLSNISIEKGIIEFLDIVKLSEQAGLPIQFVLAGPYQDNKIKQLVESRIVLLNNIKYINSVYGKSKLDFFDSIDVFLFPSHDESEGLVIHEAMSRGVPVIAYARGCIEQIITGHVGLCLKPADDFRKKTLNKIIEWLANPASFHKLSQRAVRQSAYFRKINLSRFEALCSELLITK